MKKIFTLITTLIATLLLTACFVPEKFDMAVRFSPDGSYSYKYEGTAAYYPIVRLAKTEGLKPKDQAEFEREAAKQAAKEGFKKFDKIGLGQYSIVIEAVKPPNTTSKVLDNLSISGPNKDGIYVVAGFTAKELNESDFKKIGIVIDGNFEVTLPENAEIKNTNGKVGKSMFSSTKTVSWKVTGITDKPIVRFTLKKS